MRGAARKSNLKKRTTLIDVFVYAALAAILAIGVAGLCQTNRGPKWCDGCCQYFFVGTQTHVSVKGHPDLVLCPHHWSHHVMYQNATRVGGTPIPADR